MLTSFLQQVLVNDQVEHVLSSHVNKQSTAPNHHQPCSNINFISPWRQQTQNTQTCKKQKKERKKHATV